VENIRRVMNLPPRYSVRSILIDNNNWERYKLNCSELDSYIVEEIEKMLHCCDPKKGFFTGYCKHCNKDVIMHLKCNGKACSRCGKQYVDKWVRKSRKRVAESNHRLVTLTLPADLRKLLYQRWDLLKILEDTAYQALQQVACKVLRRKKLKLGILIGLQTYGQDMRFHPHYHCMMLEKAYCSGDELKFSFIPKDLLRKIWMKLVVNNLCRAKISHQEKIFVYSMLNKFPEGFVVDVGGRSLNKTFVIRYLARYMRHPAMANSRILFYGRGKVVIKMRDKYKRDYSTWFHVNDFIARIIAHISPKHFRVVRWYGIYSRREVRLTRKKIKQEIIIGNAEHKNKVIRCPECKNLLSSVMFFPSKPPDKRLSAGRLDYWIQLDS
jgi:hypothetical protein